MTGGENGVHRDLAGAPRRWFLLSSGTRSGGTYEEPEYGAAIMLVLILDSSQQVVLIKLLYHFIQVTTPPLRQLVPDAIDEPLI